MLNVRLRWVAPEVVYSDGKFLSAGSGFVAILKEAAIASTLKRCRLCFHADSDARQHEMLIVMHKSAYVRPHRHFGRAETLLVVEGAAEAILFNEDGSVSERIKMTSPSGEGDFFYRMPPERYHTLSFLTDWLVFVETTTGPFDPTLTEAAPWAPPETHASAGHAFLKSLAVPSQAAPIR